MSVILLISIMHLCCHSCTNNVSLHQGGGSSLQDIGAVGVSDRHSQVIQQQKQTIKELRKKMTAMKEANPPSALRAMYIHTYFYVYSVHLHGHNLDLQ